MPKTSAGVIDADDSYDERPTTSANSERRVSLDIRADDLPALTLHPGLRASWPIGLTSALCA